MDRRICNFMEYADKGRLIKVCKRPMYLNGIDIDPSSGLQTTQYRCFSLNNRHDTYFTEPIPEWEEFRRERKVEIHPNGRRMTPYKRKKILNMLAQKIPYPQIAKVTGFSTPLICRMKQVTILACMAVAIRGMKCGI